MIEKRLQSLEEAIVRMTVALKDHTDALMLVAKTNPSGSWPRWPRALPAAARRQAARAHRRINKQALQDLFSDYCDRLGTDKGAKMLEAYGVESLSKLPEEHWKEVIDMMREALA